MIPIDSSNGKRASQPNNHNTHLENIPRYTLETFQRRLTRLAFLPYKAEPEEAYAMVAVREDIKAISAETPGDPSEAL